MGLAKKPVRFLFNGDSESFRISVPGTEHHYRFYKKQPYLIKFDLDIEFFDKHLMFDRVSDEVSSTVNVNSSNSTMTEGTTTYTTETDTTQASDPKVYTKEELQNMRKSDVRDILKKLDPGKSSPVRKENIIKEVLKAQESK